MKKILFIVLLYAVTLQCEVLEKIAVVVGKNIILESEIKQMMMQAKMYSKKDISESELQKEVVDNLTSNLVLYNVAQADTNIRVEYNDIEDVLNQRLNTILSNVGGEENLKSKYNTTVAKLKSEFREDVKKNLFIEQLKNNKMRKIKASRSEVVRFFDKNEHNLEDIEAFVEISQLKINYGGSKNLDEELYKQAFNVRQRIIQDSISFENAALQFSTDESTKKKGGDLGMQKRGSFVKEYERVAYNLEENEISKPIKTEFGYHLIKVIKKHINKIHTAHILFNLENEEKSDDKIALQKIKILRDSINNKEMTFEECVKKYSDDEKTRFSGGMIGRLKISELDESYRKEFEQLSAGDISIPFQQDDGYYIFKLLDKQDKHKISLKSDYNIVEEMALNEKKSKHLKKWIDELKEKVYIEVK